MNAILQRRQFSEFGIFSDLIIPGYAFPTIERAYESDGEWLPKVPDGTYTCLKGMHLLQGMTEPFATYEIMNVPGCTGILFHTGNSQKDSQGCVLVGSLRTGFFVVESRKAFRRFMDVLEGVNEFTLTVRSE